jgi:hypothetical protein
MLVQFDQFLHGDFGNFAAIDGISLDIGGNPSLQNGFYGT